MAFIEVRTQQAAAELEAKLKSLYSADAAKAINRAINKSLGVANTESNKQIRSVYNIALSTLNDVQNKRVKNSNETMLTGTIEANQQPLSLSAFNPSWTRDRVSAGRSILTKTQKGRTTKIKRGDTGVSVEIVKGNKVKLPSAFQIFNSGGSPVFARGLYGGSDGFLWGKKRLPIQKLNTKSVFFAIFSADIEKKINDKLMEYYPDRLMHEINEGLNHSYK
jgi:hypothetical protein